MPTPVYIYMEGQDRTGKKKEKQGENRDWEQGGSGHLTAAQSFASSSSSIDMMRQAGMNKTWGDGGGRLGRRTFWVPISLQVRLPLFQAGRGIHCTIYGSCARALTLHSYH